MQPILTATVACALAALLAGTGCRTPPRRPTTIEGGIAMTQPVLKMSGKVGDARYEPFELGPIQHRIGANAVASTTVIGGAEFAVIGPKMEPVLNALTLVYEAQRGRDLAKAPDEEAFRARLGELFHLHAAAVRGTVVSMNGLALDL